MELTLEAIWLYPVKSLGGIQVDEWPISPTGLQYDRQFMVVNAAGRFLSQRQLPSMALIRTAINGNQLQLSHPVQGDYQCSLRLPEATHVFEATIWRDKVSVFEPYPELSAWLTQALDSASPLRLVALADDHIRPQSQPHRFGADTHTQFADAAPFLVTNQASLHHLNQALEEQGLSKVDMRRFRPNLVISGIHAFAEHQLQSVTLQGNALSLNFIDHCERCVMTTIDPDTASKDPEMQPYKTVAELNPMPNKPRAAAFGVNAILSSSAIGTLRIGDRFEAS